MQFAFEAMRPDGTTVLDEVEAADRHAAAGTLREKGLLVLRLDEAKRGGDRAASPAHWGPARIRGRDLILFTRQMKMLLEAGTPVVPALEAAGEQTDRPMMRALLGRVRAQVEGGASLAHALAGEKGQFDAVFHTMVAAGEATASLPDVFSRLCALSQQQQQTRKLILGALLYPVLLSTLLCGVVGVLLLFVVPRFEVLFTSLNSPLPGTTKLLFQLSCALRDGWPYLVGGVLGVAVGGAVVVRLRALRPRLDRLILKLPVVGRVVARLTFARVVRIWAAMLRCHVPLLEAIGQSRQAVTNTEFLRLITQIEEVVSSGGRVGQALAATRIADPIIVSAIRTGEDNGRLAEAADFVSSWMDEDNTSTIQHVTRLAEPALLAVMGVVVGFVAMALFVPLFDLATAA